MLVDNFQPQAPLGTVAVNPAPTTATAPFKLPDGGESCVFTNNGAVDVTVEFGSDSTVTAVIAAPGTPGGYLIRAGEKEVIRLPKIKDLMAIYIATITASGTGSLLVTRGSGS